MNAAEARELAESKRDARGISQAAQRELEDILGFIGQAAASGEMSATYQVDKACFYDVAKQLFKLGYWLEPDPGGRPNKVQAYITWRGAQ